MEEFDPLKSPDPNFRVPDLTEATEGWRAWRIHGEPPPFGATPKLYSVTQHDFYWTPRRALEAECQCNAHVKDEEPPCESGSCGLYSAKTREHLLGDMCVPLDSEILTPMGWKNHRELRVGEHTLGYNPITGCNEWTSVTAINRYANREVVRIGNQHWEAFCTPKHRWWTQHRRWKGMRQAPSESLVATDALVPKGTTSDPTRLCLAAARIWQGWSEFTPDEASLIAWLVTDGHWSRQLAQIFQTKRAGVKAISRLAQVFAMPCHLRGLTGYLWTVPQRIAKSLWQRAEMDDPQGLSRAVLRMSTEALDAFMEAVWLAEGNGHVIYQNEGPVLDAIMLAAYLQGRQPRAKRASVNRPSYQRVLSLCEPYSHSYEPEKAGIQDVWCPTTRLGSWTMRQNGRILLTGNSYHLYDGERDGMYCVIGRVANWGKVIEGSLGWRAQFSYPVLLFVPYEVWKLVRPLERGYGCRVSLDNFLKPARRIA